ncbi:MAG: MFS transporter, partial [Candidatus Brockarchaeota archaeon]|nr:MFS transporter [Candidatus Brockarchaeota archaeon]
IPGIFFNIPLGLLLKKYKAKQVGIISLVLIILGTFMAATANSFNSILLGRLIFGIGGTFITLISYVIIAQWFTKEELGKAMGIFGINMPLATVIALPAASILMTYGWRFPIYLSLVIEGIALIVFFVLVNEKSTNKQDKTNVVNSLYNLETWKAGFVWLFFQASVLSFITWAPELFVVFRGMSRVNSNLLTSLIMWLSIFFAPFFGYLSDKINKRKIFIVIGSVAMSLTYVLLAFASGVELTVLIIVLGIASAMIPPVVFALTAEVSGSNLAEIGFSVLGTCLSIGATFGYPLIGYVLDVTKSYVICFLGMATFSFFNILIAYTLKPR